MAIGHSTSHARLMGAVSRKRADICFTADPPEPTLWRVFCFSRRLAFEKITPAFAGGETRIPGLARERVPEARGLLEGTARERFARSTDSRANQYGFARRREIHPERRDRICFAISSFAFWAAVWRLRVSGGEEHRLLRERTPHLGGNRLDLFPRKIRERRLVVKISDTSHHGKAVRIPPLTARTVESPREGGASRGPVLFRKEALALSSLKTDFAFPKPRLRFQFGGEECRFFVCKTRPEVQFLPLRQRCRGDRLAGRRHSPFFPEAESQITGGEETCYFDNRKVGGSSPLGRAQARP
jgi:hypothetical protein